MTFSILTKKRFIYALFFAFMFLFSSCSTIKKTSSSKKQKTKNELQKGDQVYTGMATYYANSYQGKRTASGEPYRKNKYTASVRFDVLPLPFGTIVEVFCVKSHKKVRVKVNDRMGENATAIIDLSYKAAKDIGLNIYGRTAVQIRVVSKNGK